MNIVSLARQDFHNAGLLLLLFLSGPASACTLCHSPIAAEARLRISYSFWTDLAAVLLCVPFLATVVTCALHEPGEDQ